MIHESGSAQNWKSFTESLAMQHGQCIYTQSKEAERADCLMLRSLTYLSMVCSDASLRLAETQYFVSKIRLPTGVLFVF